MADDAGSMAVGTMNAPGFGREFSLRTQAEVKHIVGTDWDEVLEKIQDLEADDFRIIGRTRAINSDGRKFVTVTKEEAMSDEQKAQLLGKKGIIKMGGIYHVDMAPKTTVIPQDENGTLLEY